MTDIEREEKKERFIAYFRDVPVQKYGAMYIGVTEQTIINWLKEDVVFFNRVQEARADWVKKKASKVRAEFALERLEKEIWQEQKITKLELDDPLDKLLGKFGIEEGDDAGKTEEA
jgi:hypothetical protein